ncbi:MAG TPA: DUF1844 domain-containing protein [Bryobacteraceae bacterium]|jgi:hypothetical protein
MAENTEDAPDFPLPPASFMFLVESILMQTQMHLGLMHFGEKDEKTEPNLTLARHSIDLLGVLQEKTKGNLTAEEQRLIENGLTELRFRFVQVSEEVKRTARSVGVVRDDSETRAAPPPPSTEKKDDRPLIITADGGKGTKTE